MADVKLLNDSTLAARAFRLVAVAEAITWVALLVAMYFKYVQDQDIVRVPGMLHGVLFMVYLVVTLWAAKVLGWSRGVAAIALVASIPPLATLVFELWAERTGRLAADDEAGLAAA